MRSPDAMKPALQSGLHNNICADEARKPFVEVHDMNHPFTEQEKQPKNDEVAERCFVEAKPDHAKFVREFVGRFATYSMTPHSVAVRGSEYLRDIITTLGCSKVGRIVCHTSDGVSSVELFGHAPKEALESLGLQRAQFKKHESRFYWRQGFTDSAAMYPLENFGQLVDLLAIAGEARR